MLMTIRQVLLEKSQSLRFVGPEAPASRAVELMVEHRIGSVVVLRCTTAVGIFTERDVLERVVAGNRDPNTTPVREVMTTPVETVRPDDTIGTTIERMTRTRHRHMPVVEFGAVVGLVSLGDLTKKLSETQQRDIRMLSSFIHGPVAV